MQMLVDLLVDHQVRTIGKHATIEHRNKRLFSVSEEYKVLDKAVKDA